MTASLTFEYANEGIRVTAVATDDREIPLRKILRNDKTSTKKEWMDALLIKLFVVPC